MFFSYLDKIYINLLNICDLFIYKIYFASPLSPLISPSLTAMIYLGYQRVKLFKSEAVKITISQLWSFAYRKFSGGSPRKMEKGHHPDSDLSVIHYMGLLCPRKKLVKVKKFYIQNILKYALLKSDRGVSAKGCSILWACQFFI